MDTSVPVVVVYRGGHGALAIARTLGRLGIPTYLVAQKGDPPIISESRYWVKKFWWDFSAPPEDSVQFLLGIGRQFGTRPILLTLADWAAIFIEDHASTLQEVFILPKAPTSVVRPLSNKWQMYLLAKKHGIPTPDTVFPQSRGDVLKFIETARFPIMVKDADPFLAQTKAIGIVHNSRDLLEKYDRAAESGDANLILQEYIPGDVENVWMCNAYFGVDSACRAIFTGKKLRQVNTTGIASLAICVANEAVEKTTKRFMQAVGYRGCVGIGYRYDARDGLYKVLDVNARVSGVFRLFRATNGMDVVRTCYLDLTGQPIPVSALSVGRKWMLEDDFFSALTSLRDGKLTLIEWAKSLLGVEETHWFAFDDPVPGLLWVWRQFLPALGSIVRRALSTKKLRSGA